MSTEWLPLQQIKFEDFKSNLPPGIQILTDKKSYFGENGFVICLNDENYGHIGQTSTGGIILEQFGPNQKTYNMPIAIGKHYNTKMMSYIGEPYEETDADFLNTSYDDLEAREYPEKH